MLFSDKIDNLYLFIYLFNHGTIHQQYQNHIYNKTLKTKHR